MLERNEQAKQRWGGAHKSIDKWLHARQDLLIEYFKLAGLPPYERESQALPALADVRNFCEMLMDYISAGHFEIYDHIIDSTDKAPQSTRDIANELFPLISDTTEIALDFNDRYSERDETSGMKNFDRELSSLGEALELRMEFEDRLLATLDQHELLVVDNES